ncbi:MAG: hypothetical protein WA051_00355 [Minisyncoccia bacterium]
MADAPKKAGGKPPVKTEGPKGHTIESFTLDILVVFFGLFILSALLARIALVFGGSARGGLFTLFNLGGLYDWFQNSAYPTIRIISLILSFLFFWGIVYSYRKLVELSKVMQAKYDPAQTQRVELSKQEMPQQKTNFKRQWENVLKHTSSNNINDWKIAILDADSMLDEALILKGYQGETMGDRLKSIEPGDLKTLDFAWEAHKYRNGIAHGNDISFNQHEVRRIIAQFEKVFTELNII